MKVRPSILLINDEKLLLMRYDYGGRMVFGIPGGNPGEGETLHETLIRELREELRLVVEPGELLFTAETTRPGSSGEPADSTLHCLFQGDISKGEPHLDPAETTAEAAEWVGIGDLETLHLYPHLGKQILQWYREHLPHKTYLGAVLQPWI